MENKQQIFENSVKVFEKKVLNYEFLGILTEDSQLMKFKGVRRNKIAIATTKHPAMDVLGKLLNDAVSFIQLDLNFSENIDIFITGLLTESQTNQLKKEVNPLGLALSIYDLDILQKSVEFAQYFQDDESFEDSIDIDSSLYDYLAMSNDSSDIKNGIYTSLLLMTIYQNGPITPLMLEQRITQKYGRAQWSIDHTLRMLRRQKKVTTPQKGGVINLTDDEKEHLERSIKESNATRYEFESKYNALLKRYNIVDDGRILLELRKLFAKKYNWKYLIDNTYNNDGRKKDNTLEEFKDAIRGRLGINTDAFIDGIHKLCKENDYLNKCSLGGAFLNLFQSDQYDDYINERKCKVFLDTPVVTYYICAKSSFESDYPIEWDNYEYNSTKDLIGYQEANAKDICFYIPHDYLSETIGELKKALQFSWFENIVDLPIPFATGNTFYNFYIVVKEYIKTYEEDELPFIKFVEKLGFVELNPESPFFFKRNMVALKTFFNTFNCIPIDLISERYNTFDDIKLKYEKYLGNNEKNKSIVAINADIRQSFYISTEVKSNKSDDSYLVSWDNTLYHLRDIVKEELELTKSYGVYKPMELANKLAFRDFRINKESVSDEIFAYADSGYNVSEKIKSLFDNVLTPYFASSKNKNSGLVVSVLKMQQASQDGREEINDNTSDKTNLERLFLSIVQKLDEYGCSKNDLTTFLSMEENNGFIIGLFEKAFNESNSSVYETISNSFCERLKESSNHKEREISLYSKSE